MPADSEARCCIWSWVDREILPQEKEAVEESSWLHERANNDRCTRFSSSTVGHGPLIALVGGLQLFRRPRELRARANCFFFGRPRAFTLPVTPVAPHPTHGSPLFLMATGDDDDASGTQSNRTKSIGS